MISHRAEATEIGRPLLVVMTVKDLALVIRLLYALAYLHMVKSGEGRQVDPPPHAITKLLEDWSAGDSSALDQLIPLVYKQLRRLAHQHLRRERRDQLLQTSALINEAYLRLVNQAELKIKNRAHFFGISARLMRQILIDEARKRNCSKRGGDAIHVSLTEAAQVVQAETANVLALDQALKKLESIDVRHSKIVELRFFGGLSIEETAEVLHVSPGTVMRDWTFARAWLRNEMKQV